ncbi:MAG: hypothetical protein ABFS46_16905 [Myxococcota bacterium]
MTARRAEQLFLRNLEVARERGELSPDRDPRALAKFLAAYDQGLATYGIVRPRGRFKSSMMQELRNLLGVGGEVD